MTRVENQQRYVGGALGRFLSPEILANPGRTSDVVSVLSRHLSVDDGLDAATVASLAWQLREVGRGGPFLLKTEMSAGHGGVSGRYERWRQTAFEYAWTLRVAGAA